MAQSLEDVPGRGILLDEIIALRWRKSTRSIGNGQCVEAARLTDGRLAVRDSVDTSGATIILFTVRNGTRSSRGSRTANSTASRRAAPCNSIWRISGKASSHAWSVAVPSVARRPSIMPAVLSPYRYHQSSPGFLRCLLRPIASPRPANTPARERPGA